MQRHHLGDRSIELGVDSLCEFLRQVLDLDVGLDASILQVPALDRVPPRELGLREESTVHEALVAANADDPTP